QPGRNHGPGQPDSEFFQPIPRTEEGSAPAAGPLRGGDHPAMKFRRVGILVALLIAAAVTAAAVWRLSQGEGTRIVPTAPVRKGEFLVIVRCRGELKARNTVQITAPHVPDLRIVWLAPSGSAVAAGDAVIRFDPSSARQQVQENEAALRQAEA